MKRGRSCRALAGALLGCSLLLAASGCSRSSSVVRARGAGNRPVRWFERDISVNVSVQDSSLDAQYATSLVQRAFAAWSPSPKVTIRRSGRALLPSEDGENSVWFGAGSGMEGALFLGQSAGETRLYSRVLRHGWEAEIIEADIFIPLRPSHARQDLERALLSVLVHEVGHFWGLDHPCVSATRARPPGEKRPHCSGREARESEAMQPDPLRNTWPDGIRPTREERRGLAHLYAEWVLP